MHAALAEDPWEYNGLLNGRPVRVLLDSGAAANFLAATVAAEMSLPLKDIEEDGVGTREWRMVPAAIVRRRNSSI